MSESMIELIARAIAEADWRGDPDIRASSAEQYAGTMWEAFAPHARSVLADLESAGYVIVPREPTEAMIRAGVQTYRGITYSGIPSWKAMISAAKETP